MSGFLVHAFLLGPRYGIAFVLLCLPWALWRRSKGDHLSLGAALTAARRNLVASAVVGIPCNMLPGGIWPLTALLAYVSPLVFVAALFSLPLLYSVLPSARLRSPAYPSLAPEPSWPPAAQTRALYTLALWAPALLLYSIPW